MKIKGFLEAFFETGTEGIIWSFYESPNRDKESQRGYEFLKSLKDGDKLTIYDNDGKILFNGIIDLDGHITQIENYWVHGCQRGIDGKNWLTWFSCEYDAELEID